MKVNVNALLGLLLCGLLMVIVVVVYRADGSSAEFRPGDFYHNLGGAATSSVSPFSSSSDGIAVSMRGVSRPSRRYAAAPAFSYAQGYSAPIANSQSPIANSSTGVLYTTSSATMKSFGAGVAAGGGMSMSGGSVRSNQSPLAYSQSPVANSQLPITNSQLPIANSPSPIAHSQSSEEAQALMAAAQYMSMSSSVHAVGASTAMGGTYTAIGGSVRGPRRSAPVGGGLGYWLDGMTGGDDPFLYEEGGIRYYDEAALRAWFEANKDNLPSLTWDQFLAYFNGAGKYAFATPVGEPWMLLILALGYAAFRFVRSRRRSAVAARN